eukprot:8610629-Pyramimonas_sp.AAC.1
MSSVPPCPQEFSESSDYFGHGVPQGFDAMTEEELRRYKYPSEDEAASVKKRPAAKTAPRKRPAAEISKEAASVKKRPAQSTGSGAQETTQESEDSHNGSYDEPPRDQPQGQLRKPTTMSQLFSRLGPSGAAPFRGLL